MAVKSLVARMDMCRTCLVLRGPFFDAYNRCERVQRCGCEPREPLWNGYDYNSAAELCRCCAWRVESAGSRWSPYFCRPCQLRVMAYNRAAGFAVIPIGRHSIMNNITLGAESAQDRKARQAFVRALPDWLPSPHSFSP